MKLHHTKGETAMMHSFLLIGQSNAAGRGFFPEAEPLDNLAGRIKVQRNGLWVPMFRPVNPDRPDSGTSFSEDFAKEYATAHPDVEVGIIPCADGGTQISQWMPGEILFDNAVHCARLAMRTSVLKGVLWHQGEGDCAPDRYPHYQENFVTVMTALRRALGLPDLPILAGGLGNFLALRAESPAVAENYGQINQALSSLAGVFPRYAFVPASGLSSNPDRLHFSAAALAEFGRRYFDAFRPFDTEEDVAAAAPRTATARTEMELL